MLHARQSRMLASNRGVLLCLSLSTLVVEANNAPPQESGGCSSTTAVLKDGRKMAPAFPTGGVSCHDISTTSVRVTWPKGSDKKYPVYAYRVCTAEVGSGFEVRVP